MTALPGRIFWVVGYFILSLRIYCALPFRPANFPQKSADRLTGVLLYITGHFSFAAFKSLSLYLIWFICRYWTILAFFAILNTVCFVVVLFGFLLLGTLCASWTWISVSFPRLEMFSAITSSNKFSAPFSLSSPSGLP